MCAGQNDEMERIMKKWEANVRRVDPYVPGEQPKCGKLIKLNTNENPYPPSPKVKQVLRGMDGDLLRRYPDPTADALVSAIAANYGLKKEEVFVGVGSDDVLAMLFMTFFNGKKKILFPDITYSFYPVWANMLRIPYEMKPLDEDFNIRKEDYYEENGGIVFPNPNAPTGKELPLSEIEDIIVHNPDVIVIVDEAYVDFGAVSSLSLIHKYDNVIVVQTFSKSRSLAGMRIGYAMANEKLISYLNDVKYAFNSYTMNQTSILAGVAAMEDKAYFEKTCAKIVATREHAKEVLAQMGFTFADAKGNFLFVTREHTDCEALYEALREHHIYVRHFNEPQRIKNYLRITIGTDEEMEALFAFLREWLDKCCK